MASDVSLRFRTDPPSAFDIVACFYPSRSDQLDKLRPALVLNQYRDKKSDNFFCEVAYGTSALKLQKRKYIDLIIQKSADLDIIGLPRATRFDLDNTQILPWSYELFGCWSGYPSPLIGSLTDIYIKEYAYCMMYRQKLHSEHNPS